MKRDKSRPADGPIVLRLYVSGSAPNSVQAIVNIKAICASHYAEASLEVVNLLENPGQAFADGIIVTPTLIKMSPPPVRRVVGNLSQTSQVMIALGTK